MPFGALNTLPLAVWPVRLEYFSGWAALGLFAAMGLPIVLLGVRALAGMGPTRKWVAIGIRLLVVLLIVLILGGIRLQRTSKDLEVMVLRDISTSTGMVQQYPGKDLPAAVETYLKAASELPGKPPDDRIGEISFMQDALIDALPNTHLVQGSKAIRDECTGTNIASAVQLGLATMQKDAMHRLLLITDGNSTTGDLDAAVNAAVAQHVPIDVMPLHYDVQHEVLMDRFVAPSWKRENEPFSLRIFLKSTDDFPVTGKLTVLHQGVPMDMDPATPGVQTTRQVTLNPPKSGDKFSITPIDVKVPPLLASGVHQFHASFEADQANATVSVTGQQPTNGKAGNGIDTLTGNNAGDAFTYVQGKGRILYVDDAPDESGVTLGRALNEEGIQITDEDHIKSSEFPSTLIQLQNYDAIILANVRYGSGGLSEDQQHNLASYVHDLGGGLVMIGGPDTFGAGGWQGRKLEEILPVSMDVPAKRQIPKGALVMVMHSCEFPSGNYYGEQCAIKAIETLSSRDEIGIVSYGWGGGSQWDFPLAEKGDGSKPIAAAKRMQVGDMPSFEDSMEVALKGGGGNKGLVDSDAAQKHVIIISDGDPGAPSAALVADYVKAKVSVSTINVYPHDLHMIAPTLTDIAKTLHGKAYGPISDNFNVLPQIFVKEASVVRRTLITESRDGIQLHRLPSSSEMVKGLGDRLPPVLGMVLTSKKSNPQIQMPITAGRENDPLLASWQTGLGRAAVYTSDAANKWGVNWVGSADYNKLWAQVVRGVARPPMSNQFEVRITQEGTKAHITVEATDKDTGFMNFLNVGGKVVGPDPTKEAIDEHLVQTGPGVYEGDFDMNDTGTYVAVMQYRDQNGNQGFLPVSGLSMNSSPELRDLQSNDAILQDIADRTKGRVLPAFDVEQAGLFSRENLAPAVSSLPIWDRLIPVLLGLILIDVAARRIAWDWVAMKRYFATSTGFVRSFTTTRKVETRGSLDALQKVRSDTEAKPAQPNRTAVAPPARPDPKAKFEAEGVAGNIADVVGGATDKPIPPPPKKIEPKGGGSAGGGMESLMEAKRRAQAKIREKENE